MVVVVGGRVEVDDVVEDVVVVVPGVDVRSSSVPGASTAPAPNVLSRPVAPRSRAPAKIAALTVETDALGDLPYARAATAATCGEAIEVPSQLS